MNKSDKTVGKVAVAFKMMRILMMMVVVMLMVVVMVVMVMMVVKITMVTMVSKVDTAFKMFDKNRDGFITKEEFAQV